MSYARPSSETCRAELAAPGNGGWSSREGAAVYPQAWADETKDDNMARRDSSLWFYVGLFFLCMSTLILQIIQTRILSVMSFYYLAFLSITMAMVARPP